MASIYIYALIDPIDNQIKYVGRTKGKLSLRLYQHKTQKSNKAKHDWFNNLLQQGTSPIIIVLEECSSDVWEERERFHIASEKEKGSPLFNISNGVKDGSRISNGGGTKKIITVSLEEATIKKVEEKAIKENRSFSHMVDILLIKAIGKK